MAADPQKPAIPGQITAPNPFEIFWEKNRKVATTVLVAAASVIAGFYGYRAFQRARIDESWAAFSQVTELGKDHAEGDSAFEQWRTAEGQIAQYWRIMSQRALVEGLPKRLGDLKTEDLRAELTRAKGADREPYLLWVLANHLRVKADYAGAKEAAERLSREFPKHHLCVQVAWPPTYVPVETPEEEAPAPGRKPQKPKMPEKAPDNASAVGLLLQGIEQDQAFRQSHQGLFEAPAPDASPTATLKVKIADQEKVIKLGFYSKQAPRLVENFLKKAKDGFFKDQHVHLLRRGPASGPAGDTASYFAFGNPQSKELDRQKWAETPPKDPLPLEESVVSPFAGMLTAPVTVAGTDGRKANPEVVHILGSDASLDYDESKSVVFGRVLEGMDVVDAICKEAFLTAAESAQGRGMPQRAIQILSLEVSQ